MAYALTVQALAPKEGGFEACSKIQLDPKLLDADCEGCPDRKFCGLRANGLLDRHARVLPLVQHAVWIQERLNVLGRMDGLTGRELARLVLLRQATQRAEAEYQRQSRDARSPIRNPDPRSHRK